MDLSQPWGALALLAVPAFVLVHLLQQRPPRVEATTLFLLPVTHARTPRGRRVARLSRRAQLLARILAALVATWLLVGPRFNPAERLRVAVVLDASASMAVFRDAARAALDAQLRALDDERGVELIALSSAPGRPGLGRGGLDALDAAFAAWRPQLGAHDLTEALTRARRAVGPEGLVLLVSDHPGEDPPDVLRLSVGRPVDNVAFTGLEVRSSHEGLIWEATVRAFTRGPVTRRWWVQAGSSKGSEGTLELASGQTKRLSGRLPEGVDRLWLVLEQDELTIDDRLPVIRPRRRQLRVHVEPSAAKLPLARRLLDVSPRIARVSSVAEADLRVLAGANPPPKTTAGPPWLWFLDDEGLELRPPAVGAVAEQDPLTERLGWSSLVFRAPPRRRLPEGARGLLWQGKTPVAWRGPRGSFGLGLDPRGGSAAKSAPLVVLLSRYLEQVRGQVPRAEALGVEVGQPLSVPARPGAGQVELRTEEGRHARESGAELFAPPRPGFFTVTQGDTVLLEGAARFADVRECDLREAREGAPAISDVEAVSARGRRPDPYRAHWTLVLLGLMLASFALGSRARE